MDERIKTIEEMKNSWINIFKNALRFVGILLIIVGIIMYVVIMDITLNGLEIKLKQEQMLTFLAITAIASIFMLIAGMIQGYDFAKMLPEVKVLHSELENLLAVSKDVWIMPLWLYSLKQIIMNVIFKIGSIIIMTYFILEVSIQPLTTDPDIIAKYKDLTNTNVMLFIGFGILAITTSFDRYVTKEVVNIKRKINRIKEKKADELSKEVARTTRQGLREGADTRGNSGSADEEGFVEGSTIRNPEVTRTAFGFEE